MTKFASVLLIFVFFAAIGLIVFLFIWHRDKETWATITGLLAVVAAALAVWPAMRVLELQDESSRPRPIPYFDLSGRYGLLQFRVKNIGPSVAYEVELHWKSHPINYKGEEITSLDEIPVLPPDHSVSAIVGSSMEFVKKYSSERFEVEVAFKDDLGKSHHRKFVCGTREYGQRLHFDEELPKTLHDLQELPERLEQIVKTLKDVRGSQQQEQSDNDFDQERLS